MNDMTATGALPPNATTLPNGAPVADDILYGAKEIGAFLRLSERQVYGLVETNPDFPARKMGTSRQARLFARKSKLIAWLETLESRDRKPAA